MSGLRPEDVQLVDLEPLTPYPGNPRRHDVEGLRQSIRRFGQQRVILVQRSTGFIVAGHGTRMAMMAEGIEQGLVAYSDLTDTEAMAYLLADNQWADRGFNDEDALATMLRELFARDALDDAVGFESRELDAYLREPGKADQDDAPDLPEPHDVWVKPGDLFRLGRHRLLCGDATQEGDYTTLLGQAKADMIWTDPPYGVEVEGGTAEHLTIVNDERDEPQLARLLEAAFGAAVTHVRQGGAVYCAAPGGEQATVFVAALKRLGIYRQTIIWVKDALVLGRQDYHWRHELVHHGITPSEGRFNVKAASNIHYGWRPGAAHWFVDDRTLDTVWEIPRPRRNAEHPTMKPVELVERCLTASTRRKQAVLDPFAGSGTTIIAAERTDRIAYAMELDPRYAQVCVERWQHYTGQTAEVAA